MFSGNTIIQTVIKVVQWLLSLFFILGGLAGAFQGQILAGVFCMGIGLLLFPPAKTLWQKMPLISKPWVRGGAIFLLFICMAIAVPPADKKPATQETKVTLTQPEKKQEDKEVVTETPVVKVKSSSNVIAGLSPVDVYGNFEKKGFVIDKRFTEKTASWTCTDTDNGIEYTSEVYATDDVGKVSSVEYTALRTNPERNSVEDMKAFLKYGASLPYDAAEPSKVAQFIEDNYYNNESHVIVNGVKFTLYVPSDYSRILSVEPE